MSARRIINLAREFIKDKPLSEEDKTSFVYCIAAEYHTVPMVKSTTTTKVLSHYYTEYFEQRERS